MPSVIPSKFMFLISRLFDPRYVFDYSSSHAFGFVCSFVRSSVYRLLPDSFTILRTTPIPLQRTNFRIMDSFPSTSSQNTSPQQNPAELAQLVATIEHHAQALNAFQAQLTDLRNATTHAATNVTRNPEPMTPLALPEKFNGTPDHCKGFLQQCRIHFTTQSDRYVSETNKCAFIFSLLSGQALEWASAVWNTDPQIRDSSVYFMSQIQEVFEHPAGGMDISNQLFDIRQGERSAADYAIQFRTLAAQSRWDEVPLKAAYKRGLNTRLQAELICRDDNCSLSQFITLSVRTDNLLRNSPVVASEPARRTRAFDTPSTAPAPEPMQLGYTRLSPQERQRRYEAHLCFYCGG
ncbi:MAG: DUF4939 domain-containing protein, partial [Brevinema sp.]